MFNKNDPVAKKVLAYTESKEFKKELTMTKVYCKATTIKTKQFDGSNEEVITEP